MHVRGKGTVNFMFFCQPDCLTGKEVERIENIYEAVLLSEKTTTQRKARVSKYRHWVSKSN